MDMSAEVTIYTKPGCPYCAAAKEHYKKLGVAYDEIDVYDIPGAKQRAIELAGGRSIVPVIVDKGEIQVGFGGG
jgi:glutaredoxin